MIKALADGVDVDRRLVDRGGLVETLFGDIEDGDVGKAGGREGRLVFRHECFVCVGSRTS